MLAHLTSTTPRYPSAAADSTTPPSLPTEPPAWCSRDDIAGHVFALPTVRELRCPFDATFDPRAW
jgi:hypothetical protein